MTARVGQKAPDFTALSYSPFTDKSQAPVLASLSQAIGEVEIYPESAEELQDPEEFPHKVLLYIFHKSYSCSLIIKPFLDD
jgi:tRNA (Thr-GGU) A37 N-methylase